jgi:trehalose 6-phosphate synthase
MLQTHAEMRNNVTLMQIAPPSRPDVGGYMEIRRELETTAGNINGRFADFDWVPIRYLNKSFEHEELTCFYRGSRVAMVTPLRDGMKLVAKEFVAAQNPRDPGVLVLSRFAGAAHEMDEALIVNPYDEDEVAEALFRGLTMPIEERKQRHGAMLSRLRRHDVHSWRNDFLNALQRTPVIA